MAKHHPLFSPSAAHRWMHCTASIDIVRALPDVPSEASKEGTAAHAAFAHILQYGAMAVGEPLPEGYTYTREMRDALHPAVLRAMQLINGCSYNVEQSVNFKLAKDTLYGTADLLVMDGNTLRVVDLKFGRGVRVHAKDNEQLMLYALAAMDSFDWWGDFETVELHILQPRLDHYDVHIMKKPALYAFSSRVETAVAAYHAGAVSFVPGNKQCRWCPYAGQCAAASERVVQMFADIAPDAPKLDTEKMLDILEAAPFIEHTLKAAREQAVRLQLEGQKLPGWKVVEGRTQRRWKDPDAVAQNLVECDEPPYKEPELRSVADIEKSVSKSVFEKRFKPLVHKPEGRPTLAKESDKRPALLSNAEKFEKLNEGT